MARPFVSFARVTLRHPGRVLVIALGRDRRPRDRSVAGSRTSCGRPRSASPGPNPGAPATLVHRYFGDTAPFAILLQGPPAELDRQGPALIRKLRTDPAVTTVSPWDKGSVANLRPGPRKALILVDFHVSAEEAVKNTVPYLDRTLDEQITPPVPRGRERLRQPLARDHRRVGPLDRRRRADRDPLPAARPAARLPLAGRRGDPARLRRGHGDRLARRARDRRQLDRDRRLRADRLLDDGPGARGRLRPLDGLALPRGAGGRRARRSRRRG